MKRIIRLTENDLARIVRRVIREEENAAPPNNGLKAFQTIMAGMSGLGTNEDMVNRGVLMIKNKLDYDTCLSYVKKEGYDTIMCYIGTDMSYAKEYDSSQGASVKDFGQKGNNPYLRAFLNILNKYNSNEKICSKMGI